MRVQTFLALAAFAVFSQAAVLNTGLRCVNGICGPKLLKRVECHSDNLLRNLKDKRYSVDASAFCSIYIQSTSTVILSATATSSTTVTETPIANTVTQIDTISVTETDTIIITHPTAVNTFVKRAAIPYPTWLAASNPAVSVSSACSCFVSPSPAVVLTSTTTGTTQTNIVTTTLVPLTNTQTSFLTETHRATSTATVGESIHCAVVGCTNYESIIDSTIALDPAGCRANCLQTPSCVLYQFGGYGSDRRYCNLLSNPISAAYASGYSTDPGCIGFSFYDLECIV